MRDFSPSSSKLLRPLSFAKVWKTMLFVLMLGMGVNASAQNITVKGTVIDNTDEPLIGASVQVEGTKNAAAADLDGNFTLKNVSPKATLVVSYIGYKTQKVAVNGQTEIKIVLTDDSQALEEVVVVGYGGTRARRDLTGSVGSVSGAKLASIPVTSAAVALQGKVAGVQVTTVDGQPGADINIRVRGATSVTQSNDPLYIVDGFQQDNINDIPPSDIQSIDILKDASLTAIYGAKGGNGVVIVTTKSAQEGKTQVSFNSQLSWNHISKQLDLMNTADFVLYQWDYAVGGQGSHVNHDASNRRQQLFRYNFGTASDIELYKKAPTHDWQDEVMGNTPMSYSTNLSIGGGNDKTRYNVSFTQSEDKGIILGSGVRRTNILTKLQTKILPNLTLQFNPKMTYRRDEGAGGEHVGTGGIIDVLRYRPTNGIRELGGYYDPDYILDQTQEDIFTLNNPVYDIKTNVRKRHSYTFANQGSLEYKPIDGLTLRTEGVYSLHFNQDNRFWGPLTSEGQNNNNLPVAQIEKYQQDMYTWTTTASYDWTIKDVHNFYALIGYELYHRQRTTSTQKNRYFPENITASKAFDNMGLGTPYESTSARSTAYRTNSYFGQINYNYDHKYLASVTFRADGSSMFSPGNQWGYFPSVSAAWVLSQENFMKDIEWINEFKLRAAIGKAGNNNVDADMWRYLYTINSTSGPAFGESGAAGNGNSNEGDQYYAIGDYLPNPDIKWETTLTRNVALDLAFFNNRLRITPEFYWNTTSDLIYRSPVITTTGYKYQFRNIGQVTNKGFELSVNGDILRGRDYVLSANFNLGANKMKVDKLTGDRTYEEQKHSRSKDIFDSNYRLEVGGEVGLIYGFVYDGLYSLDEFTWDVARNEYVAKEGTVDMNGIYKSSQSGDATNPGKIKYKDLDNNGIIDDRDRTVIGRTTPKIQGGFGLSGQWKDFDFSTNFTFFLDFDVYNATAYYLSSSINNDNKFYNVLNDFTNRWTYLDGVEGVYRATYWDGPTTAKDRYEEINAGQTRHNPMDMNQEVTASQFVEDGSFLRCNDITIGYTLPTKLVNRAHLQKLRFYASLTNPFIITKYSGYDPEVDIQSGLTPNYDFNRYPRSRGYVIGLNLTF